MRCSVSLCIALTLLVQVAGKRVHLSTDELDLTDSELNFDANTHDALDDFLDGVSSPTGPENRPPNSPNGNPILTSGTHEENLERQGQEKLLRLEEVAEREAEDYEEMKVEEVCVEVSHAREESSYEAEQLEVVAEKSKVSKGSETEPYHKCDKIWGTHKSIYETFFRTLSTPYSAPGSYPRSAARPMFPERLGEFVIQEIRHIDAEEGKHVLLVMRGCTSCINELTTVVDWGGLAPVDENGEYHKRSSGMRSEQIVKVRKSYSCLKSRNSCKSNGDYHDWMDPGNMMGTKVPAVDEDGSRVKETQKDKYVERATYLFSSFKGDTIIEPLLEETRTAGGPERREKLATIGVELRHEEKHVPFNHELEEVHMDLFLCAEKSGGLQCAPANEELVLHDGAVLGGSTSTSMLDQLGDKDHCTYGACQRDTYMTECLPNSCVSPSVFQKYNNQNDLCYGGQVEGMALGVNKSGGLPGSTHFSCIKERASGVDAPIVSGSMHTQGLFFRTGTQSKAHITGHLQWHVTVPTPGTCTPELGDSFYIGMGVSEADPCTGTAGPDLDLGVVFYACKGGSAVGMKETSPSKCEVLNHRTWGNWGKNNAIAHWAQYSGDSQGGEGGGDDEWFFIRLDAMRQLGVTHIAITTHLYGCEGNPNINVAFSQLEGAFMRFASGPTEKENFQGVETFAYLDVDVSMAKTPYKGAVMAVLFLETPSEHPLPTSHREWVESGRTDEAHSVGQRWQVGFLADPIRGSNSYNLKGGGTLTQVTAQTFGNTEITDESRIDSADGLTKMQTGHKDATGGAGNVLEALTTQQVSGFESEDHRDSSSATDARTMTQEHFYQEYSYTFASGHPGTSLYCFA